eukprot:SAG31_NODE_26806_length_436_cov_0.902077_2_plen_21_part_01
MDTDLVFEAIVKEEHFTCFPA